MRWLKTHTFKSPFLIRSSDASICFKSLFRIDESSLCKVTRLPCGVYSCANVDEAGTGFGAHKSRNTFSILTNTEQTLWFIITAISSCN